MSKVRSRPVEVKIAVLKSKLSEYLARVRRGEEVTVLDRNTPIALIIPMPSVQAKAQLELEPGRGSGNITKMKGRRVGISKVSSLEILLEDRDSP